MRELTIKQTGDLALEMKVPGQKTERLAITDPYYPRTGVARALFQQLGTMHLIAPYLPKRINIDFAIHYEILGLIFGMYRSCDALIPVISYASNNFPDIGRVRPSPSRAVVAYSAGKDSIRNAALAHERCGREGTLIAHISGLNPSNASEERKYSRLQAKALGFPHYREIDLLNSSSNRGYATMRSRDLFLTGILVPIALQFGASTILTEGFAEAKPTEPFSGQEKVMAGFNDSLATMGIPVAIDWENKPEMDIIRELYTKKPSWMPYMCNCFHVPYRKPRVRRSWKRRAPSFPLYASQCGSCVKCRITNVARILYDPDVVRKASAKDIAFYLTDTAIWARRRRQELSDMLEGSFVRDLNTALQSYELDDRILSAA